MTARPATERRPTGLTLAGVVVALQALALMGFAGWQLLRRIEQTPSNEAVFQGATAYLLLFGLLVLVVAVALFRRQRWAFSAAVFLQLLALGVTFEMTRAGLWLGAMPLGAAAVTALVGLFSPAGRKALGR